jgi:hypothetical protein
MSGIAGMFKSLFHIPAGESVWIGLIIMKPDILSPVDESSAQPAGYQRVSVEHRKHGGGSHSMTVSRPVPG